MANLIGLTGFAGAGKDSMASALVGKGYRSLAFADPLKNMMCAFLGVSRKQLEDREFKESTHPLLKGKTVRYALQTLGTEWGRNCIASDLWTSYAGQQILDLRNPSKNGGLENGIVVTDIRFDNEAQVIKSLGGIVIQINRTGQVSIGSSHLSERGVSPHLVDAVFENAGELVVARENFLQLVSGF